MNRKRPILFVRLGWMTAYSGVTKSDRLWFDGEEVPITRFNGHESEAFLARDGRYFMAFWPQWDGTAQKERIRDVDINRLGAVSRALYVDGIDIIFVGQPRQSKTFRLIGYYDDARVYRRLQVLPDEHFEYNITTRIHDAALFPEHSRPEIHGLQWYQGMHRYGVDKPAYRAVVKLCDQLRAGERRSASTRTRRFEPPYPAK